MSTRLRSTLCCLFLLASQPMASAAELAVPAPLRGWEPWVLHGSEYRNCPFLLAQDPGAQSSYRCAWPGRLALAVDARGGSFTQSWQVYADTWITLPGSPEHWPQSVRIDGQSAPVVERGGVPQLRVQAGNHQLSGRFEWSVRPERLEIAAATAIVDLGVNGQKIAQPERPNGALSLGRSQRSAQAAALDVQVHRLLSDDIPARLETRIRLQVAGDAREEMLAQALPAGFTPVALSGDLPARLDADGRLRVQVRAGTHELQLRARGTAIAARLRRPAVGAGAGVWPGVEVWSFAGIDRLRVATATGAESVDPSQAEVPEDWRNLPAYRMENATELAIEESQRGLAHTDENRLRLDRDLWLDFDHQGYIAHDSISGQMRRDWRLDMSAPYRLESARSGATQLLVTEGSTSLRGVELRAPKLALEATARLERRGGAQPATGWSARYDGVNGRLHLPPGHRLLAAIGPDEADGTWWSQWGLWSLFGVLILVVATFRIAGLVAAGCALGGLVLSYQEWPSMVWLWLNLLIVMALAAVVPDGKLRRFVHGYRLVAVALVALALLPFCWWQIRYAIYPQLESGGIAYNATSAMQAVQDARLESVNAPAASAAEMPAPAELSADEAMAPNTEIKQRPRKMAPSGSGGAAVYNDLYNGSAPGRSANAGYVPRYAAGTALQTGPGIPEWDYRVYPYSWSGPVEPADQLRFLIIGPWLLGLWRIAGVLLLVLWLLQLAQRIWRFDVRLPGGLRLGAAAAPALAALALLSPGVAARAEPAGATGVPGSELLQELQRRLLEPPACQPACGSLMAASVNISGDLLSVDLEASALGSVALPIPSASDRWQIETLSVDGGAGSTVMRESDSSLWVPLRAGAHRIHIAGRVAAVGTLQLGFPVVPHTISVHAQGWTSAGVSDGHLVSNAVEFTRLRSAQPGGATGAFERGAEFPAFVRVQRDFNLDLDWTIATSVQRVAPESASITAEVPLVAGESVLTPGFKVRGGAVLAGLAAGSAATTWQSTLPRSTELKLAMGAAADRTESWTFSVSPEWHAEFSGFPAVLPADTEAPNWLYTYYPRPGENLTVRVTRPKGAEGATVAIDRIAQQIRYGVRSAESQLSLNYRSTQGGRQVIDLPAGAVVEQVLIDGQPQQLRPEQGKLPLGLLPGEHSVSVNWRSALAAGLLTRPEPVDVHMPVSNISTQIFLPQDRWVLFVWSGRAGVGPALLYWGELVAFLAFAWALGRWKDSPLRTRECLLLGLGLSTQSWSVFALVIVWFLLMRWRQHWRPAAGGRVLFNVMQVVLALATAVSIGSLVFSGIRYGLFSTPDMGVAGDSGPEAFHWFRDRVDGALPRPGVFSVPLWVYKTLIFAWALWVASALTRWLKWAWECWSSGGYWRGAAG